MVIQVYSFHKYRFIEDTEKLKEYILTQINFICSFHIFISFSTHAYLI